MLIVEPIKAYTDNYIWLVSTNEGSIVVDPGESKEILNLIDSNKIDLKGVLITHHHYDHTNGLLDLTNKMNLEVYGPKKIEGINNIVKESDKFSLIGINFEVIEIPGHTLDHLAFYSFNNKDPILFCGDTLFAGGCGRVFEGTFEQMFKSLKKISNYPKETKIFCGHEYTLSNLKFALEVDEDNKLLADEYINVKNLISSDIPSLPTSLNKELKMNPFLRCNEINIKNKVTDKFDIIDDELEIFTALRKWKDNF
ncbi:hydroxyacylglutathione hydrolase [Gammaproteobacteria bacterium]|nr:hydroxyacylglutathione hydrolase [Gammaproteobacteria bacterium]